MISRLSGILVEKDPPNRGIDVGGVGYEVEAPMSVFYDLPDTDQPIVILTHMQVSQDHQTLYGFRSSAERTLFRQLLKISGIGAKLALTILSGAFVDEPVAKGQALRESGWSGRKGGHDRMVEQ